MYTFVDEFSFQKESNKMFQITLFVDGGGHFRMLFAFERPLEVHSFFDNSLLPSQQSDALSKLTIFVQCTFSLCPVILEQNASRMICCRCVPFHTTRFPQYIL